MSTANRLRENKAKRLRALANDPSEQTLHLQKLINTGGVSRVGLRDLLRRLESRPDLLAGSAGRLYDASESRWLLVRQREALPTTNGRQSIWEFCNPNLLLAMLVNESPALQEVQSGCVQRSSLLHQGYPCDLYY